MRPFRLSAPANRWLALLLWAIIAAYLGFIVNAYREGRDNALAGGRPLFTDFTSTYGAALVLSQAPVEYVYHRNHIVAATAHASSLAYGGTLRPEQRKVGFAPFMYPPTFMPAIIPLAYFPYHVALIGWLLLTALPYLLAVRGALHGLPFGHLFALASPPAFYNLMFGQTGFLSGGLIGLGLLQLERRPWLAGLLLGLASVKPHLGVLIPFALLAGGYWRSVLAASLTVLLMVAGTVAAFGAEPWFAFIGASLSHAEGFQHGGFTWSNMPSVLSVAFLSGASLDNALLWQGGAAIGAVLAVCYVWWRSRDLPQLFALKCAVLLLLVPLAVPLVFLYDLAVIVPGIAFLLGELWRRSAPLLHWGLVITATFSLLAVKPLGAVPGIHLAMAAQFTLLATALIYWRRGLISAP